MKTAWITGACGFTGQNLAKELAARGHEVRCIDRSEKDLPEDFPGTRLHLDLMDDQQVLKNMQREKPAMIFHLAAQSSGALSFKEPRATLRNNLESTLSLLEALRVIKEEGAALLERN